MKFQMEVKSVWQYAFVLSALEAACEDETRFGTKGTKMIQQFIKDNSMEVLR